MKILMVCLGNICRSPLADGLLQKKVNELGLSVEVDSAGTSAFHIGSQPDPRTQENALKHDLDLSHLRARQFEVSDFDNFDIIFTMDDSNYRNVISLARNEGDKAKVHYLLNESNPGSNANVPDPYYGSGDGFETVYQLVNEACDALIKNRL